VKQRATEQTLTVALLTFDTCTPIAILGPKDILSTPCASSQTASSHEIRRMIFDIQLVSLTKKPLCFGRSVVLHPDASIATAGPPGLVLIPPPAGCDMIVEAVETNRDFVPWIKACASRGTRVTSYCTGAFLLAETGLLDGRAATTNWQCADLFRKMYPKVDLHPDRLIVDQGNVITAGATTSFQDLMLYLIELYSGREAAIMTAKAMLLEMGRQSQLPFTNFSTHKTHDDQQILRVQHVIESESHQRLTINKMAKSAGMSLRNFERRFRNATGELPSAYVQKMRIEKAKRLLETSTDTVDQIITKVGYTDRRSFRRLFRNLTALSPREYRRKYGIGDRNAKLTAPSVSRHRAYYTPSPPPSHRART